MCYAGVHLHGYLAFLFSLFVNVPLGKLRVNAIVFPLYPKGFMALRFGGARFLV